MDETREPKLALRPREAAEVLSISESTLHRLRLAGKIPAVKAGQTVLYRMDDLKAFLKSPEPAGV